MASHTLAHVKTKFFDLSTWLSTAVTHARYAFICIRILENLHASHS